MSLFQRLFRKTTGQPALPSDVLVSLLYAKLLATPDEHVCTSGRLMGFSAALPSGKFCWFEFRLETKGVRSATYSAPTLKVWSRPVEDWCQALYSTEGLLRTLKLPRTSTVDSMVHAMRVKNNTATDRARANKEASAQLAALDLVNDLLGLPSPEEQLALGQPYPRAEAVTVARPAPPQAKELRR